MCVRERRCTQYTVQHCCMRSLENCVRTHSGERHQVRINHVTITITRHTLQLHSHTSQDHPFAPPICLLQTRFLARRHTMIVPHRHTANPITLASLIAQSRFTFAQPLASTRLHHSATAGSTASSAPGHILITHNRRINVAHRRPRIIAAGRAAHAEFVDGTSVEVLGPDHLLGVHLLEGVGAAAYSLPLCEFARRHLGQ